MITIVETIRALSQVVETVFGEAPTTKDITEGFTRPCTYIQPALLETETARGLRHDTYQIEIIRFEAAKRPGYLHLLEAQRKLTEALERPVPVSDAFVLYPEDLEFELRRDEMSLTASFAVENYQLLPPEDADTETMENLELSRKE